MFVLAMALNCPAFVSYSFNSIFLIMVSFIMLPCLLTCKITEAHGRFLNVRSYSEQFCVAKLPKAPDKNTQVMIFPLVNVAVLKLLIS